MASQVLFENTQMVPLKKLKPYGKNPRKGNVQAIAESLKENAQYRPIVVQKATGQILAGNHTWQAARVLGWDEIAVVYVDVDDDHAKKIVLADNRTNDLASYDNQVLNELLKDLDSVTGTGYTEDDLEIISRVAESAQGPAGGYQTPDLSQADLQRVIGDYAPLGDDSEDIEPAGRYEAPDLEDDDPSVATFENAEEQQGVFALDPTIMFLPGYSKWEIPDFRTDRFVRKLPEPLVTWAGSATKDWPDPDVWWLYNYGVDSTSGMRDVSRVVLAFWVFDQYMERWWTYPDRYTMKALNSGIKSVITPDFSCNGLPRVASLWQLYRSRWLGRFFQEAGLDIIPDLEWREGDPEYLELLCAGIPRGIPYVALQAQNIDDWYNDDKRRQGVEDDYRYIVDTIQPETLFVYTNDRGEKWVRSLNLPCELHIQETRIVKLAAQANARQKKTTL